MFVRRRVRERAAGPPGRGRGGEGRSRRSARIYWVGRQDVAQEVEKWAESAAEASAAHFARFFLFPVRHPVQPTSSLGKFSRQAAATQTVLPLLPQVREGANQRMTQLSEGADS